MRGREELQDEFEELDALGLKPSKTVAADRGLRFERLINELFDAQGLLLRGGYHTTEGRAEQIDGAIALGERVVLIEAKWVRANLAASDLFAFLGKVEGKFVGTIGIFISRRPLKDNFLGALRSGRRQSVLVIHGEDVDQMFDPGFPLKDYLTAQIRHVSTENTPHLSAERFLSISKELKSPAEDTGEAWSEDVTRLIANCESDEKFKNLTGEWVADHDDETRVSAAVEIIKFWPKIVDSGGWQYENYVAVLEELAKQLPNQETPADVCLFIEGVSKDYRDEDYDAFAPWADRIGLLAPEHRSKMEQRLLKQWKVVDGDYSAENEMVPWTRRTWGLLSIDTKRALGTRFAEFLLSHRYARFAQYKFAKTALSDLSSDAAGQQTVDEIVQEMANEAIDSYVSAGWDEVDPLTKRISDVLKKLSPYSRTLNDIIDAAVESKLDT